MGFAGTSDVLAFFFYPPKGNLLYPPIFLHSPSISLPKLKIRRAFKRKKERKLRRKRGRTSFDFFQLILSFFSQKRKEFRKRRGKIPTPSPLPKKKRERKREKRNKKKEKRGEKGKILHSFAFLLPLLPQKEKRRKRKGDLFFLSLIPKRKEEEKRGK